MLKLRSATAIIAIVTIAVSGFAILSGLDWFVAVGGFIPARLSGMIELAGALRSHSLEVKPLQDYY